MKRLHLPSVHPIRGICLPFLVLTGMNLISSGQEYHPKTFESALRSSIAKSNPDDRITLEAERRGYEAQYKYSEEYARKIAEEYREAVDRKSPDSVELTKLKRSLEVAVTTSFKNQLLLQQTRLKLAELDLIELDEKHQRRVSLADKIITRRIADLLSGEDRGWSKQGEPADQNGEQDREQGNEPNGEATPEDPAPGEDDVAERIPDFNTPRELLDYLFQTTHDDQDISAKVRVFLSLMTEDEQNRFAGICLRTASMVKSAAKMAAGLSVLGPDGQNAEVIRMGTELETLINESRLEKAPRKAQIAFDQISATDMNLFQVLLSSQTPSTPRTIEPKEYSAKLRRAAGVLKDPVQFCIDLVTLMADFSEEVGDKAEHANADIDWDKIEIRLEGDHAYVITHQGNTTIGATPFLTNQMELVRDGDTWKIASSVDDKTLLEIQQGIMVSNSSTKKNRSTEEPAAEPEISPEEDVEEEKAEPDQPDPQPDDNEAKEEAEAE
jgi:hypothetical protein